MSDKSPSSGLGLKIILSVAVITGAVFVGLRLLRPVAVVEEVISGNALDAKPGSVTVLAEYSMDLKSELGGRILHQGFNLDPGKRVKEGDPLVQLDAGDVALEIEQIQHDYDAAKNRVAVGSSIALELDSDRSDLTNDERLYKLGQFSDSDLQKQRRLVKTVEQRLALEKVANDQQLETYETNLKAKERQRDKMAIVAPFDGEISVVYAHPGDLIGTGASIATLITTSRMVQAKISEEDFADIRVDQKASVIFLPYGEWVYNGKVTKILPTADPETQRHLVNIEIADIEPSKLVPGITGEVSIVVGEHFAKAIIPRRALVFGDNVYVVKDGKVELRPVKKGFVWLTGVEITQGLAAGERVIVSDQDHFHAGDSVSVEVLAADAFHKKS